MHDNCGAASGVTPSTSTWNWNFFSGESASRAS
jgi:hypothetical protein